MKKARIRDIKTLTKQRLYFKADSNGLEHGDYAELEKPEYYKVPMINLNLDGLHIYSLKMDYAEVIARSILKLIKSFKESELGRSENTQSLTAVPADGTSITGGK